MANGIINLTSTSGYMMGRIVWESVGKTVTCSLQLSATGGHTGTSGTWNWSIGIGLASDSGGTYKSVKTTWVEVASFTASASGSTVTISASCNYPSGTSQEGYRCYGSATVQIAEEEPEQAAAAVINTASNAYFGDRTYVTWESTDKSYFYRVRLECGERSGSYIASPYSTGLLEYGCIIPYDFMDQLGSALTGTVTVTLSTHTASSCTSYNQVGEASSVTIVATVPDNESTRPVITGVDYHPSPDTLSGPYVQNYSGVVFEQITAEGNYGATIERLYFRVEGKEYGEADDFVSAPLAQYGSLTAMVYAVDNRGFRSEGWPVTIEVIPYSKPKLRPVNGQKRVTAIRCNSDGSENDQGAWIRILAKREYSPVVYEGQQKNFCAIFYRYKPDSSESWSAWSEILAASADSDEVITDPLIGALAAQSTYQVEIMAIDVLDGMGTAIVTVSSDRIYDHADGARGSYGFGKYVDLDNVFDIAEDKTLILRGAFEPYGEAKLFLLNLAHPVGSVLETVDSEDPGGSLGGVWVLVEETESSNKWRRTE